MTTKALKIIADAMQEMGIEYGLGIYEGNPIVYPYFVGTYQEIEPNTEDGLQESTVQLNGYTRSTWLSLENAKASIENYFNKISGKTVIAENGSAVAIFYTSSLIVPTGDAELKRIQVNLAVKEWSVE